LIFVIFKVLYRGSISLIVDRSHLQNSLKKIAETFVFLDLENIRSGNPSQGKEEEEDAQYV
jgi:hypothetical protein